MLVVPDDRLALGEAHPIRHILYGAKHQKTQYRLTEIVPVTFCEDKGTWKQTALDQKDLIWGLDSKHPDLDSNEGRRILNSASRC